MVFPKVMQQMWNGIKNRAPPRHLSGLYPLTRHAHRLAVLGSPIAKWPSWQQEPKPYGRCFPSSLLLSFVLQFLWNTLPHGSESINVISSDDRFVPGGLGWLGFTIGMCVLRHSFLWLKCMRFLQCQCPRRSQTRKISWKPSERGAPLGGREVGTWRHI